jgi:hypothetical protein
MGRLLPPPLAPLSGAAAAAAHLICGSLQACRSIVSSSRSARCAQSTVGWSGIAER